MTIHWKAVDQCGAVCFSILESLSILNLAVPVQIEKVDVLSNTSVDHDDC